jgi:uncharacterized protein DUF2393
MADPNITPTASEPPHPGPDMVFGQPSPEDKPSRVPLAIGISVVVLAVAFAAILGRSGSQAGAKPDPYVQKIQLSGLHLLRAENFVGGQVTYLEGTINNSGDRTVVGATARVTFHNSLNEVAQQEKLPILIVTTRQPYTDTTSLKNAPLKPGQSREFQLTFEHVSAEWDGVMPEVTVTGVNLQ